jgi:hypothetical protein
MPRPAHRSLRSPPDPGMTTPCSGRSMSATCNARYSSSGNSPFASEVKIEVSTKRMEEGTPLAYMGQDESWWVV